MIHSLQINRLLESGFKSLSLTLAGKTVHFAMLIAFFLWFFLFFFIFKHNNILLGLMGYLLLLSLFFLYERSLTTNYLCFYWFAQCVKLFLWLEHMAILCLYEFILLILMFT